MAESIQKVLVANRGEIATRIIRAARDAGIATVAVYADQDIDALFVQLADEAFALGGTTAPDTYLHMGKIIAYANRSGADAVHPGYGFLAENAHFARAVIEAGLVWIGPPPPAIEALGDKVRARHIAQRVGAPLAAGTPDPVNGADEVVEFARAHGLPVAIKAAFGGGGRGLKVARTMEEIPDRFASATREAIAAFGRGECFVERFLERPRHVETQCLADVHGNVVVVSTRDCSLQRRHQKVVEEAPAPFLTPEQHEVLVDSSKAILAEAGYVGAGTCEFLIGADGTVSFLEVNTRLQVEHPVSEEVTGIDLVLEQFRIAQGGELDYEDPEPHGHALEFRINAEDPARDFAPTPGTITALHLPTGPGVRVDEGYLAGMTVPGQFDSLLAKVIVKGADREQAIARARRALEELRVDGVGTTAGFHRAVLSDPAFTAPGGSLGVHTTWIETEFSAELPPQVPGPVEDETTQARTIAVEVDGRRLEVRLPADLARSTRTPARKTSRSAAVSVGASTSAGPPDGAIASPMPCKVVEIVAAEGVPVAAGDPVLVVEAMKMEQSLNAPRDGVVTGLRVEPGQNLVAGEILCRVE